MNKEELLERYEARRDVEGGGDRPVVTESTERSAAR